MLLALTSAVNGPVDAAYLADYKARYPELRACTKDQVVFLDGGSRTVPVSELHMPVTLAQADSVVAQLR